MREDWFQLETQRQAQEAMDVADDHGHPLGTRDWSDMQLLRPIGLTFFGAVLMVVLSTALL